MSIPYTDTGRTAQKSRTREALIDAARSLLDSGFTPTIEEAGAAAGISRTTAYRYFGNQRELLSEVVPFIEMPSLLANDAPRDPAARLDQVLDTYLGFTLANEPALRAALRLSLDSHEDTQPLLRRGRVLPWIKEALEPVRSLLGESGVDRLATAIRSAAGIEALVWLVDVRQMTRSDAVDLMKWSAQALLRGALEGAGR